MQGRVVFIVGAPHSGSTLLSLILGSHSRGFALNELDAFTKHGGRRHQTRGRRCHVCEGDCPFWDERVSSLALARRFGGPAPWQGAASRLPRPRGSLYPHLMAASGADLLIDSSKNPAWVEARLGERGLGGSGPEPLIVRLVRDGRATVAAHRRKRHRDVAVEALTGRWLGWMDGIDAVLGRHPGLLRATLAYEGLAAEPEGEVRRLCDALGDRLRAGDAAILGARAPSAARQRGHALAHHALARGRGGAGPRGEPGAWRPLPLPGPRDSPRRALARGARRGGDGGVERLAGARNRALLEEARA